MHYEYEILFIVEGQNGSSEWAAASKPNISLGPNLLHILNLAGADGWKVVGLGDFGNSPRSEIVLMRP